MDHGIPKFCHCEILKHAVSSCNHKKINKNPKISLPIWASDDNVYSKMLYYIAYCACSYILTQYGSKTVYLDHILS